MRYTRRDVEAAFKRIMRAIGAENDYSALDVYSTGERRADGKWYGVPGWYVLDYAACYGGYRIVRCVGEAGGVHDVTIRMPARQFCEAADFMTRILADKGQGR